MMLDDLSGSRIFEIANLTNSKFKLKVQSESSSDSVKNHSQISLQVDLKTFRTQFDVNDIHKTRRIMIVDDEPYNLMGLKVILEAAAPEMDISSLIDTATNGHEALNLIKYAFH
jgi:hypothetical protein